VKLRNMRCVLASSLADVKRLLLSLLITASRLTHVYLFFHRGTLRSYFKRGDKQDASIEGALATLARLTRTPSFASSMCVLWPQLR
jgi:hypothetical protein